VTHLKDELSAQRTLIRKGYLYTAANNLFAMSIDYEFIISLMEGKNISQIVADTNRCLSSYSSAQKRTDNWEWVASSIMRRYWSESRLSSSDVLLDRLKTEDEEYEVLYSVLQAKAWCEVSKRLNIEGQGQTIDEGRIKDFAKLKLDQVGYMFSTTPSVDDEGLWHMKMAEDEFDDGEYIASIYESCYAYSLQKYHDDSLKDIFHDGNTTLISDSKWAKLYMNQYVYLNATGDRSSHLLYLMARCIDESYDKISTTLENGSTMAGQERINGSTQGHEHLLFFDTEVLLRLLLAFQSLLSIYVVVRSQTGTGVNTSRNR